MRKDCSSRLSSWSESPAFRRGEEVKPRVLFLGGLGRSGTTLLERLLGELPGVCALGEVVHLWQRGLLDGERCGCGEPFRECPFWHEVGARAFGGWDAFNVDRVLALQGAVDRTRYIPALTAGRLRGPVARQVTAYTGIYRDLYAAAAEVSGCDVVIDSSKHASLAFCLRWADLDLRVLHVVRDSRAVAYSWARQVARPEGSGEDAYMTRWSPAGTAVHWNAQNAAFELLGSLGVPVRRLRYEDAMAHPVEAGRHVADLAGTEMSPHMVDLLRSGSAQLTTKHTASGNPMRFQTGRITLRRDDAWRTALRGPHRRVVTALTYPLLARYGYARSR